MTTTAPAVRVVARARETAITAWTRWMRLVDAQANHPQPHHRTVTAAEVWYERTSAATTASTKQGTGSNRLSPHISTCTSYKVPSNKIYHEATRWTPKDLKSSGSTIPFLSRPLTTCIFMTAERPALRISSFSFPSSSLSLPTLVALMHRAFLLGLCPDYSRQLVGIFRILHVLHSDGIKAFKRYISPRSP
jgi:hypothetical protein